MLVPSRLILQKKKMICGKIYSHDKQIEFATLFCMHGQSIITAHHRLQRCDRSILSSHEKVGVIAKPHKKSKAYILTHLYQSGY
jgi:hypothetical protein